MRKLIVLSIIHLFTNYSFGQHGWFDSLHEKTDSIIEIIDNNRLAKSFSFRENNKRYNYLIQDGRLAKIICLFNSKNEKTEQVFYIHNNYLISAGESITSFHNPAKTDSTRWSGSYTFSKDKLIEYYTNGHVKSETDKWDREKEVLYNYKQARLAVLNNSRKRGK